MKKISIKLLALTTSIILLLTGCLKDEDYENGRRGIKIDNSLKIIEFATDDSRFNMSAMDFVNRDTVVNLAIVRLASNEVAQEDINVTLTLASSGALVANYNTDHGTNFVQFPFSLYVLQGNGLVVTIPKGSREGFLKAKVNTSTFDPSSLYALGFSIASVDKPGYTISQNFKTFIAGIGAKNKYDGVYEITGTLVDANGVYIGDYGDPQAPRIYEMSTTGASSILFFDPSWNFANYVVVNATTGAGANTGIRPEFTFDPNTNLLISAVNKVNGTALVVGAGSKFNPADRSFDIKWSLGRWSVTEHWKFLRDR
jgi:hypothetical protein